jgi:hypothetical protein
VKVVQVRLSHDSAKTTLDIYSKLFPDEEDRTRVAIDAVLAASCGDSVGISARLREKSNYGKGFCLDVVVEHELLGRSPDLAERAF